MAEYDDELAVGQRLLGLRIRDRRDELELPRRIIANRSGVGYNTLVSIEAGRRLPNLSTLHRIARTLDTTARELLEGIYPWDSVDPPTE
jgi:transcriptional regulator with XRE-family HTH domain